MARRRPGQRDPDRPRPAPYRGPGSRTGPPTLGVDVGGVIVDRIATGEDTSFFGSRPLESPAVAGMFEALARLAERFDGRVHVVSKAGPKVAANTTAWLHHVGFFDRIGVAADHLHFVRRRADKAPVCARLGVTHFVDDHLDVLAWLTTVEHRYLFLGGLGDEEPPTVTPDWAVPAATWPELADLIDATLT